MLYQPLAALEGAVEITIDEKGITLEVLEAAPLEMSVRRSVMAAYRSSTDGDGSAGSQGEERELPGIVFGSNGIDIDFEQLSESMKGGAILGELAIAAGTLPFGGASGSVAKPGLFSRLWRFIFGRGNKVVPKAGTRPLARTLSAAGDDFLLKKAVNSKLAHAIERGVQRGVFGSADEARAALRGLTDSITRSGTFPAGTVVDPARAGRFLVPVGNNGRAVSQLGRNGTAKLKTVLIGR